MEILVLLLIIGFFYLSQKLKGLSEEVTELRREVLSRATISPAASSQVERVDTINVSGQPQNYAPTMTVPSPLPVAAVATPSLPAKDNGGDMFLAWLKEDFMVKLGALLLLIGFGWFVSYAFAKDWIGPMGRISLGLITGVLIMAGGFLRIEKRPQQGGIFTVLGSTTVILTLYAAREIYGMFTPESALVMMLLSVAFVAFVSVRYDRLSMAMSGLILAGFAPMLTASPTPDVVGLFLYLLVIVLGTLWVVYVRGWSLLTFSALVMVSLYGAPYVFGGVRASEVDSALMFAFVFTAIFFVANLVGFVFNDNEKNRGHHMAIALGTGMYLITWVWLAAPAEWQSLILSAWMLVFSFGSFIVYRHINSLEPFYVYGATSVALLAAATASELSGPTLYIAYIVELTLLVVLSIKIFAGTKIPLNLSWLYAGLVLSSLFSIQSTAWSGGALHEDSALLVILTLCLFLVGITFHKTENVLYKKATEVFVFIGGAYVLVLIWLFLHAGTHASSYGSYYNATSSDYQTATILSLIIYTIIGIVAYVKGLRMGNKSVSLMGSILLGLVVAQMVFVEVWSMDITGKIITFIVIGALLISTAFVKRSISSQSELNNNN